MEWQKGNYTISTSKIKINLEFVHAFLSGSYWAQDIPLSTVKKSVEGSLCFGVYSGQQQIGFARVITDEATFGYLADVFIDQEFRGRGLSKWLMQVITQYPALQQLRRFMLATKDAHALYSQFGFENLTHPDRWMQIHKPNLYKQNIRAGN